MLLYTTSGIYQSESEAKEVFRKEISNIKSIYKNGMAVESLDGNTKVISIGKYQNTGRQFASIINLKGTAVNTIEASSLRYALAFQKRPAESH